VAKAVKKRGEQSLRRGRGEQKKRKRLVGQQIRRKTGEGKRRWKSITKKSKPWYLNGSIGG